MENKYYSVEEISTMLQMHPKTVQRYIREGKIKAVKLGKAWRIDENALQSYINKNANFEEDSISRTSINTAYDKINISSVIDIDVSSNDEAMRISNAITAAMNSKPREYSKSTLNTQYIAHELKLRIMIWGNINFTETIISMLKSYI